MARKKHSENEVVIKKKKKKDKIDVSQFIFDWEDVPGKGEKGIRDYLRDSFFIDWSKKAKIEKTGKFITVSYNKHKIKFELDEVGYVFSLKAAYRNYMSEGKISEQLRDAFYQNKVFVPARTEVKKVKEGLWNVIWNRPDGLVDIYTVEDTGTNAIDSLKVYNEGWVFVENEDGVRENLIVRKKDGKLMIYSNVLIIENVVASITLDFSKVQSEYVVDNRLDIENIISKEYIKIYEKEGLNIINNEIFKEGAKTKEGREDLKEIMGEDLYCALKKAIDEEGTSKKDAEKRMGVFRKVIKKAVEEGIIGEIIKKQFQTFLYNKSRFPGIVYRLKDMELAMLLFDSGSVICTGAGREEFVAKAKDSLIEKLKEFNINLKSEPKTELQNIVASTMFYPKINLDVLADYDENTEYEPEQFPGLIYKIEDPKTVMLVFRSGRIVITGAKSVDFAIKASKMTKKAIMDAEALILE